MKSLPWIRRVLVVGAGTMGRGIAQVVLGPGYEVTLVDPDEDARNAATSSIKQGLQKQERSSGFSRLTLQPALPEEGPFQVGIEAVPEKLGVKRDVLGRMEPLVSECLSTNTSSLPLSELDEALQRPMQLIGLHFMNPAPVMDLVELIVRPHTPSGVIRKGEDFIESLEKTPARVKDTPGFVSNRLLMGLINRAVRLLEREVAPPETIDRIMRQGMGHAMGPLEVADFIGLDVCLETMRSIDQRVSDRSCEPPDLLRRKVRRGDLGRKTGSGFYEYGKDDR